MSGAAAAASPTLLVLAAGRGSRFGGLKQMAPIGPQGETMLDFSVFDAVRAGFGRVVFVVGADFAEVFRERAERRYAAAVDVACVSQSLDDVPAGIPVAPGRTRPWGTLHAVLAARDHVATPFAVVNADDFYGRQAFGNIAGFFAGATPPATESDTPQRCCMVGYALARTLSGNGGVNRGICVEREGLLGTVVEHTGIVRDGSGRACRGTDPTGREVPLAADAVASMNAWGFTPAVFAPMARHFADFLRREGASLSAECYLPSLVDAMIGTGQATCRVLPTRDDWFGVTYAGDRERCAAGIGALIASGVYNAPLWPMS